MSDVPAERVQEAPGSTLNWRRLLWAIVATSLALAGLWDSRTLLLGTQPSARAVGLPDTSGAAIPASWTVNGIALRRTERSLLAENGAVAVSMDLLRGRLTLRWPATADASAVTLSGAQAGTQIQGLSGGGAAGALLAADYARHAAAVAPLANRLGNGLTITFRHVDPRFPDLVQMVQLYRDSPALLLRVSVGTTGGPLLSVARLDPLRVSGAGAIAVPGNTNPLVLAVNGLTADHMPRQYVPLAALPRDVPLPYLTTLASPRGGALLAGALSMADWFPAIRVAHGVDGIGELDLAGNGPVTGRQIGSETYFLGRFRDSRTALSTYASALSRLTGAPAATSVQMGWSSWGAYEQGVSEAKVRRNAAFMATQLRRLGYSLIHIDDGWQRTYGDWEAGPAFPHGMGALAHSIHAQGLRASIWLAPFLTSPDAWPALQHPDWLLRNPDGSPIQVMVSSPTDVLDVSNPAVLQYIKAVCARIRNWGFDAVKLDFLYAGSLEGQRYRFDQNGIQAYAAAMRLVRDTLEADPSHRIYLIGVQQGFLPAGYFDGWRVGRDIESKTNADHIPTWDLVRREALAVSTYAFADGVLYGTDPDDLLLRRSRGARNLTYDEARTYATMEALGGGIWLSGDDLPALAAQGGLAYLTNPEVLGVVRAGRAGLPIDVSDQATGPASVWCAQQSDGTVVLGLFDWGQRPRTVTTSLAALGLPSGRRYRMRDLWQRRDLGATSGHITVTLRPHQSYLLRLTPAG